VTKAQAGRKGGRVRSKAKSLAACRRNEARRVEQKKSASEIRRYLRAATETIKKFAELAKP